MARISTTSYENRKEQQRLGLQMSRADAEAFANGDKEATEAIKAAVAAALAGPVTKPNAKQES